MALAIAVLVAITRWWLVSLLNLLLLFRGPIAVIALLAERSHLRQQSDGENHRHQYDHQYSLHFFHNYLPPSYTLRFHA